MSLIKGLVITGLVAVPMAASAIQRVDTYQAHNNVQVNAPTVSTPEPGTLALLLAGLSSVAVARRRRRDP